MKLAARMARIGTETAFEVLVRARALEARGRNIIHLEIGEPDFATPRHIVEAGKTALDEGWTHYGPTQGLPELRESIAKYISRTRSIDVGPQHEDDRAPFPPESDRRSDSCPRYLRHRGAGARPRRAHPIR